MDASDACEITWHLSQVAAGSTATITVFAILKEWYNRSTAPQRQAPVRPQQTVPTPPAASNQKKQRGKGKNNPSSSASSSSSSQAQANLQELKSIFLNGHREKTQPQESYYEKLKNLPGRCAQAITRENLIKSWITVAVAIAAYTTTLAGIEGIVDYFV